MKIDKILLWENNPRKISDEAFEKLKQSLKDDIDYLTQQKIKINKIDWKFIVYAWNQRIKALRELWYKDLKDEWLTIDEISEKEMIKRWILDNEGFWEYDRDKLSALKKYASDEFDLDFSKFNLPSTSIHKLNSLCNGFEMPDFSDDLSWFDSWNWADIEDLNDENSKKKREQNYIIRSEIIFDDELQREKWNYFLHWLKENVWGETLSERLSNFIDEQLPWQKN